jgi:intracellular sulfur oxidation DsrE/DsrF family protein
MQTFSIRCNSHWLDYSRSAFMAALLFITYLLSPSIAHTEEFNALKSDKPGKALIDFRTGNPRLALIYLKLIGDTYKDQDAQVKAAHPDFVVNFGGESVKLLAKDPKGYTPEEKKMIDEIKQKISALASEGIKFDYCLYGGNLFGVQPANVEGVGNVDNGWVSLVNYQAKGYSLIPAY